MSKKIINSILGIFSLFFLFTSLFSATMFSKADAGWLCASGIGNNLKANSIPINKTKIDFPDVGNRRYTAMELFGDSISYSEVYGITKDTLIQAENNEIISGASVTAEQTKRLEEQGSTCAGREIASFFGFGGWGGSLSIGVSKGLANTLNWFVTKVFDDGLVCKESTSTNCINLLGTIGGETGIIKTLSNGIFIPLSTVAFLGVACWLMWTGIVKKEFRASMTGVAWALFCFVLGVLTLVRPTLVATIPQSANSVIASCIVDAMNGESCTDSSSNRVEDVSYDVCDSVATGADFSVNSQLKMSALSCNISKGFVLDQWSLLQFGYTFDELWTSGGPDGVTLFTDKDGLVGNATDYCVTLGSSSSPKNFNSSTAFDQGTPQCNVALAYLANVTQGNFNTKATLSQIVLTATKNDKMWAAMTSTKSFPFMQFFSAIVIVITFIPITIFSLSYSLVGIILMAFAPIYCLIGIHPGRGRKIFLGWLETVISNILKYMASALLVFVMILIFGKAFAGLSGIMRFVASIIMAFAFLKYRKEFVNLIGATNMGGAKMANKAEQSMNKHLDNISSHVSDRTKATVGGSIGGVLAAKSSGESIVKGMTKGAKDGFKQDMKRGRGVMANAVRTGDRLANENKRQISETQKEQKRMDSIKEVRDDIANIMANDQVQQFDNRKQQFDDLASQNPIMKQLNDYGLNSIHNDLQNNKDNVLNSQDNEEFNNNKQQFDLSVNNAQKLTVHIEQAKGNTKQGIKNFAKEQRKNGFESYNNNLKPSIEKVNDMVQSNEFAQSKLENLLAKQQAELQKVNNDSYNKLRNKDYSEINLSDLNKQETEIKNIIDKHKEELNQFVSDYDNNFDDRNKNHSTINKNSISLDDKNKSISQQSILDDKKQITKDKRE